MPRPEIRDLTEEHLADAARLLAGRHVRHRRVEPLLDDRYERPDIAAAEVDACFRTDGASGAVAVVGGRTVGYVLGAPRASAAWGPNIWVEAAGQALADDVDAELVRDLYAHAAQSWVDAGCTAHVALVPSQDARLVDAWFRLAFGLQHVHGVREAPQTAGRPSTDGYVIRRAVAGDIAALGALDVLLDDHQRVSPVFSGYPPASLEDSVAEWTEGIDDPDFTTWVAERDGRVVGSAIGCSMTKSSALSGLCSSPNAGHLAFAAVLPEARGAGIGKALGETVLAWSTESGYSAVGVDWRATNLLSSRTWPQLGFRPTFLRLHRLVGF